MSQIYSLQEFCILTCCTQERCTDDRPSMQQKKSGGSHYLTYRHEVAPTDLLAWHLARCIRVIIRTLRRGGRLTYLDNTSILVVGQDASSPKNRRTSALAHPQRSLAGIPYTKQSYSQSWGTLGSVPRSTLLDRRNWNGCTYHMV